MSKSEEGQVLWEPSEQRRRESNIFRYSQWLSGRVGRRFATYDELWRWSVDNLEEFWASIWDYCGVIASKRPTQVLADRSMPGARWFPGAELNYAEHVLRHDGDKPALIFVSEDGQRTELSWQDLRADVAAFAATLRDLGVGRGDRVVAYIPNIPQAVVAFLACASIGAVWSSCSPDFGTRSVVDRFRQIGPKILIAVDGYRYGGTAFDRTDVVAELRAALPSLAHTIAVSYLQPSRARDGVLTWERCIDRSEALTFEQLPFDHPLWVLYSSGTTGIPKGIVHGHGGIVVDLLGSLALHFDLGPDDTFLWFTTTGWVMWNILVSGMMLGSTAVLYDGSPGYPGTGRLWQVAAESQATLFGMSASYIAACAKDGVEPAKTCDLSHLKAASFTGSPLAPQLYRWIYDHVDPEIWFSSVSGGTDICGPFVGGNPMLPVRAGEIQCRCLGVNVQAFDAEGRPVIDEVGELVCTDPLPSMPLFLWGDAGGSRYRESYFDTYPGVWRHGDWIKLSSQGSAVIYGRSDATINRMGVRMGSAEIYRAVEDLPEVLDSLVIDLTYRDRESSLLLLLFVVLRDGVVLDEGLKGRIRAYVRTGTSPRHVPDEIIAVPDVPKTLNHKKLEVPIRKILLGMRPEDAINRDSMSNPDALDHFITLAQTHFASAR
ncbi:MAG: acetoacetate--CoA ligase [Nitriliruptorales bacterium]|nr:acetoacetate--CoA ligase [Nitriliruptorales bacterium]